VTVLPGLEEIPKLLPLFVVVVEPSALFGFWFPELPCGLPCASFNIPSGIVSSLQEV
jgi:hypothetical protein